MLSKKLMALMALSPTPTGPVGQQAWTTPGTYSWTVPEGVTSVCAVCVGGGGAGGYDGSRYYSGGSGGSLAYANNVSVTPGETLSVVVGVGGILNAYAASASTVQRGSTILCSGGRYGQTNVGTAAWAGGAGVSAGAKKGFPVGAGGAGGYAGPGGNGSFTTTATPGSGGGAAGGTSTAGLYGGGGVGIYGQGASGTSAGMGGSGGANGTGGAGGAFGGGSGNSSGAGGAVRIIWGSGRAYPFTNTGDM